MSRVLVIVALLLVTACGAPMTQVIAAGAPGSSGEADLVLPALAVLPTPEPAPPAPEPAAPPPVESAVAAPAPAPPPPAPAAPAVYALSAGATYSDCSGASPLTSRTTIYRDTCVPGIYLLAHNPGVGGTFFGYGVGTLLSYGGTVYTVRSVAYMSPAQAWGQAFANPPVLALQTCANESGSTVLVVRAS